MQILNIAGYKFVTISDTEALRGRFLETCESLSLKGTILVTPEGVNISLAGVESDVESFLVYLNQDSRFSGISFHRTYSDRVPFRKMKVKLKEEIITFRQPEVNPVAERGGVISPKELKKWYEEGHEMTVLDTRNDYEYRFGTFKNAINPHISHFDQLPEVVDGLDRDKPVVMFCTGGVRCEKASIYMEKHGFKDVRQLEGGILGYFAEVGGDYYDGECFVFDGRIAVDEKLQETGTIQCLTCQGPLPVQSQGNCSYCA